MSFFSWRRPNTRALAPLPTAVALLAMLSVLTPAAQAANTLVADNTAATRAGTVASTTSEWLAASFTLDELTDGDTLLATLLASTDSGSAGLTLYSSDASNLIPASALASFTATGGTDGTLTFSLSGLSLTAGTYWAVLSNTAGTTQWSWTEDSGGSGAGFTGAWANSDDGGSTWFSNSTLYPLQAAIAVSSVPEPTTWVLGLAGAAGLVGKRRQTQKSINRH